MRISPRSMIIGTAAAALVAGAGLMAGVNAYAAAGCRVSYSVVNQWPGGFGANVEVTNLGDPVNGWNLVWTFTAGQRVTQMWNATYSQPAATVTATNVSYMVSTPVRSG